MTTDKNAFLIAAPSGSGKTVLAGLLAGRGIPSVSTDLFLHAVLRHPSHADTALSRSLCEAYPTDANLNLGAVGRTVAAKQPLADEFCALLVEACPLDKASFSIEGEALMHPSIQGGLKARLENHAFAVSVLSPASTGTTMTAGVPDSTIVNTPMSAAQVADAVAKFLKSLPPSEDISGRYLEVSVTATHGPERVSLFSATADRKKIS